MPVEAKPLFRPDVLRSHFSNFKLPDVDTSKLSHWANEVSTGRIDRFGEKEILPHFLSDVLIGILGYVGPAGQDRYTIGFERHVEVDGKYADAVLGEFNGHQKYFVALEGKGPRDPLDRPYAGRRMSAVDQGYRYAINLPCDWILVTSIRQTRLYHKGSDQQTYERFDTEKLATDEEALRRFIFLLGADRVVPKSGRCHFYDLLAESQRVGRELTKSFYLNYADMRQDAFEQLSRDNSEVPRHDVLSGTQKLLDRVLFVAFCEDRGLLPPESICKAYEHKDLYHPKPVWENFRGLFKAIDRGNQALGIDAYNGGLFADDPILDSFQISDEVCGFFRDLGEFDYKPASEASGESKVIDVEILGHIFEQSITDIEKLRNELDGLTEPVGVEKHKTRRKKEGAFYTPAFITRYIVEQSLGRTLKDRFEHLKSEHLKCAKGAAKTVLQDPRVYELDKLTKPARTALVTFWEAWQDELITIRILDPACGSGAFLIESFDQMHTAYERSNDRLAELRGYRSLFDLDKRILECNLYGVDLNEEAVQICKLSLWIKTAERGKTLTSLDHTIRVGNSVVADPTVHPKAFDWQTAFPEVIRQGGFDVVVGNPPYIRQEWIAPFKPYWKSAYECFDGVADIFTYFYELGVKLLRLNGRLGFITSGSWVRGNYGDKLRKYLSCNSAVESMIDFGEFQPFEGAEMIRPTITLLKKGKIGSEMRLYKWLTAGRPPENLSDVIDVSPTMRTDHLGSDSWELETDSVRALVKKLITNGQPLKRYLPQGVIRGIVTGRNEAFIIDEKTREKLICEHNNSASIIHPYVMGTDVHGWHIMERNRFIVFTYQGIEIAEYPAIRAHLEQFKDSLIPKGEPGSTNLARKAGSYKWYEIQDVSLFRVHFEKPKIVWPDIAKLPRFTIDTSGAYLDATCCLIPGEDYFLLGILNSWLTWFLISKTCQPLRLRGDRWQYRLKKQWIVNLPIPDASDEDRGVIGSFARRACDLGRDRYDAQSRVQDRLRKSFGESVDGYPLGALNEKAQAWWELSPNQLGIALKASFRLPSNPLMNPRTADEWEPYLLEKRAAIERLNRELTDAEQEINERVFRLFNLTSDEISLLMREVEH